MRAALVKDLPPPEPAKPVAKQDKATAKKVSAKAENTDKPAEQPAAVEATPTTEVPAKTEQVLTETWSYQLSADE
ncbi:hypothetical protein D9M71_579570 [compost metagenome]